MEAHEEYQELLDACDEADLRRRTQACVERLGFDGFIYANILPSTIASPSFRYIIGTYSQAWLTRYAEAGYGAIDPACRHCMGEHTTPLVWTSPLFREAGVDAMYEEARAHGVSAGISVPLYDAVGHNPAGMGMACGADADLAAADLRPRLSRAMLLANYFQEAASRLMTPYLNGHTGELTRREAECLAWLADGLSLEQTSTRMIMTGEELQRHLESARRKLGARSLPQTIARAFAGGLFTVVPGQANRPLVETLQGAALSLRQRALEALTSRIQTGRPFRAALINLDNFRRVNNALGYQAGNTLLTQAADRLRHRLTAGGELLCLEADAFLVLLPEGGGDDDYESLLAALRPPMDIRGLSFNFTASMGTACFPLHGEEPAGLFRCAEMALHRAKERGGDRREDFVDRLGREAHQAATIEGELRLALERDQLRLHYQPIFASRERQLAGFEALARWTSPRFGPVPPDRFVPVAEHSGLARLLDDWTLEQACRQMACWRQARHGEVFIAVNFTPHRFLDPHLVSRVFQALADHGLPATVLKIEITERLFMDEDPAVRERLTELRRQGVRISLDDFGTGYSSLAYLTRFPVDELKIDRSFVRGVAAGTEHAALVEAITAMAHRLGIRVVAEGVEQESERDFLEHCGCDYLQGYLLGKPADAAGIETLLARSGA